MQVNKRLTIILLPLLLAVLFVCCMKEKGSYVYKDINAIEIDTIETRTVQLGDTLEIVPSFTQTMNQGEDSLEYLWYWYKFGFVNADTISRSRNLKYTVPISTSLGTYTTVFKVYDKRTGVFYKWTFNVNVTAAAAEGVLVLSDVDGNANLGLLNIAKKYVGNIYYDANGSYAGKNPVSLGFIKTNAVPYLNAIVIMCDDGKGGVITHHMDFKKVYDYKDFFFVPPNVIKPQRYYNGITGLDARYDFIINNNQLHVREYRNAQRTEEKTFFKPALPPLDIEVAQSAIVNGTTLLFYDNTNYRFMRVGVTSLQYLSKEFIPVYIGTQDPAKMSFDPNNVGLKLIYMAPGWKNYGYGIFKDPQTGQLYRLNFSIASLAFNTPFSAYYKKPINNAPDIETASDYAFSISDPYLYYSKDKTLYRYDLEFDKTEPIYHLDSVVSGSKIDKLYMRYYAGQTVHSSKLYVASSEQGKTGKNGSIHVLLLNQNGTVDKVDTVYRNVTGRVVGMDYKF